MKKYEHNYGKNPEGVLSTTSGYATETTNFGEAAFGILNKSTRDKSNFTTPEVVSSSTATLFSVGNGSDGIRKNIIELKADGTVYISGIGSYDGTTTDGASTIQDTIQDTNDQVQNVIEELEKVNTSIDSINIEKSQDSDLVYTLRVDGEDRGTINIPKDQFLKDVSYNDVTNELVFTFVTKDTDNKEVRVNLTDLVDIYTSGNGINIDNKQISVKIDGTSDPYIQISADGVKITGIDEALEDYLPLSGGTMTGNITFESAPDSNGHEYVDLGLPSGNLWAKYNIGANSEEEGGLYFQWGDTQGYTAEQVGDGEGLKAFDWADYKFSIDGSSSNFSKYNTSDSKTILDPEDDAAHVNMGGNWRMPTFDEYKELCLNTDIYLVPTEGEEIQGTVQEQNGNVRIHWASQAGGTSKGVKFYKKSDKQTYMFVPVSGRAYDRSIQKVSKNGYMWSSSRVAGFSSILVTSAWLFGFDAFDGYVGNTDRRYGQPVRGVLSSNTENSKGIIIDGKTESDLLNAAGSTTTVQSILDQVPEPDLSPLQNAIGDNTYEGSNYLTKETNLTDAVIQLDEEIKATNDNLALEHANAEATYVTKEELNGYLPLVFGDQKDLEGGSLRIYNTGVIDKSKADYVSIGHSQNAPRVYIYEAGGSSGGGDSLVLEGTGISLNETRNNRFRVDLSTDLGLDLRCKTDNIHVVLSNGFNNNDRGLRIYEGSASNYLLKINPNGVALANKTSQDLLNAGGSTTPISDITTQVQESLTVATSSADGLMSAADKTKLDSIDTQNLATKSEVNAKVSGTGVSSIQVVATLPDVQEEGVLYIVTGEGV